MKQMYSLNNIENNNIFKNSKMNPVAKFLQNKYNQTASSSTSSLDSGVFTIQFSSPEKDHTNRSPKFTRQRFTYLDVKPLSWKEKLYLARIRYLTISNGIRFIIVALCLSTFGYFASTTLSSLYETVIHLEDKPPTQTLPPAISICTHCVLCSFSDKAVSEIGAKQFLTANINDFMPKNGSNKDIFIDCLLLPKGSGAGNPRYGCQQLVTTVKSSEESRKCTTFFSDINGETQRALKNYSSQLELQYDHSPRITLKIYGNYIRTSTISTTGFENIRDVVDGNGTTIDQNVNTTGLYLVLHDASILPYMLNMPVKQLLPGKLTTTSFVKRVQRLLPAPYDSNCTEYGFKSSLYKSRGSCIITCLWAKINANKSCTNFYSIFTTDMIKEKENNERMFKLRSMINDPNQSMLNSTVDIDLNGVIKICPQSKRSFKRYLKAKTECLDECPTGCHVETFEDHSMYDSEIEDKDVSQIEIYWYPEPVVYIYENPKWQLNDLLGNIGAITYFWLSFSVSTAIVYVIKFIKTWEIFPKSVCGL